MDHTLPVCLVPRVPSTSPTQLRLRKARDYHNLSPTLSPGPSTVPVLGNSVASKQLYLVSNNIKPQSDTLYISCSGNPWTGEEKLSFLLLHKLKFFPLPLSPAFSLPAGDAHWIWKDNLCLLPAREMSYLFTGSCLPRRHGFPIIWVGDGHELGILRGPGMTLKGSLGLLCPSQHGHPWQPRTQLLSPHELPTLLQGGVS